MSYERSTHARMGHGRSRGARLDEASLTNRLANLLAAHDEYLNARYISSVETLAQETSVEANLLCVRALYRLQRLEDAASILKRIHARRDLDEHQQAEAAVLAFIRHTRSLDLGSFDHDRSNAKSMVERLGAVDLESEFWATDATLAYASNDLDRCERSAWSAIHCDLTFGTTPTSSRLSVVPISNSKARALQALAVTRSSQGRFHEQLRFQREAVVTLKRVLPADLYLLAFCYMNLSFIARDFGVLDDIVELELVDTAVWPQSLHWPALEIERSCSWLYALAGNAARAVQNFERLARERERNSGRDGIWLATVADAMIVAKASEVSLATIPVNNEAAAVAERFDWRGHPEQRFALTLFARAVSSQEPDRAAWLIERDDELGDTVNSLANTDRRNVADRAFRVGIVSANRGLREKAFESIAQAYAIWFEYGQRWQAVDAALELVATGFDDGSFARYAKRESAAYPNSWLARRANALVIGSPSSISSS